MVTLANRIKELRLTKNLTQSQLGQIIGVGKTTISMYENGNSSPNDEIKIKLADFFEVSIDYLLGKTDIRNYAINEPTVALHSDNDYDDLPQEAKDEINNFIDYIRNKYKK